MKYIIIFAVFLASAAFAQEAPTVEGVTTQANDTIAVVREQRDRAEDQEAQAKIALAKVRRELAAAQTEIAALKAAVY
jgi:hypothetical protein